MDKFRKIKSICSRYSIQLKDPVCIITKNSIHAPIDMKSITSPVSDVKRATSPVSINTFTSPVSIYTFKSNISQN